MTGAQAINKALKVFSKEGKGDVRTVELWEGTGCGDSWKDLRIHIGFSINGDYSESKKEPFVVNVYESEGRIKAEKVD